MADSTVEGFLDSVREVDIAETGGAKPKDQDRPQKKKPRRSRGISGLNELNSGILTVGGGQVLTEFEDKSLSGRIDDEADDTPSAPVLNETKEDQPDKDTGTQSTQDTQGTQSTQGTQNTQSTSDMKKAQDTSKILSSSEDEDKIVKEVSGLSRKIDKLISADKQIQQTLEGMKGTGEAGEGKDLETAIKNEIKSQFGNIRGIIDALSKNVEQLKAGPATNIQPAEEVKAEEKEVTSIEAKNEDKSSNNNIPPQFENKAPQGDMVSREEYEALLKENEKNETSYSKAWNTVKKLAEEISNKDERIKALEKENARLSDERNRLEAALRKAAAKMGSQNGQKGPQPNNVQNGREVHNVQQAHKAQEVYNGQNVQKQGGRPPQKTNGAEWGADPWGNDHPPVPDLLGEEEPKKKNGFFHRKNK